MQNAISPQSARPARRPVGPAVDGDIAGSIARQTLSSREAAYSTEVRALLDAALQVMRRCGTASKPRVADIVAQAGLSNEAFYRHFRSKDDLVAALLADGSTRLVRYVAHQMAKESTAEGQVRRWVAGVLSQAQGDTAATTLAVLWNGGSIGTGPVSGRHFAAAPLASLLAEPFRALGSHDPEGDALLVAHAALGKVSDSLWQGRSPSPADIDAVAAFGLRAARPS